MAPISPGLTPGPLRKTKKPTATTKAHRFESFTRRISKLKIDPIHRVEQTPSFQQDSDLSQSHFRTSLDRWTELNLCRTFTDFLKKVSPLSESLPQLLYHSDATFELLIEHIEKRDPLALEPLLSLVAHFAHDLGQKFEKYFARIVTLVAQIAASQDAPDVVEWCYTCLAWIFKFLSRLLVPDLRPLLAVMTPHLRSRKTHVVRFTAESVAFLLRKAAVIYPKNKIPLSNTIIYLLEDLNETDEDINSSYSMGLMILFSEAALGTERVLHTGGPHLVSCIIDYLTGKLSVENSGLRVLEGVLIRLIHQTDSEGFRPFMHLINRFMLSLNPHCTESQAILGQRLLFLAIATRKGSRVGVWKDAIQSLLHVQQITFAAGEVSPLHRERLTIIAMIMQYAPMNEILPNVLSLIQSVTETSNISQFLQFCELFATLGRDRFRTMLLPSFQQYILSHWQENEYALCLSIHNLTNKDSTHPEPGRKTIVEIPPDWELHIIETSERSLEGKEEPFDVLINAYVGLADLVKFPRDDFNLRRLQNILHRTLISELQSGLPSTDTPRRRFILGQGFNAYLNLTNQVGVTDPALWKSISSLTLDHFRLQPFLSALISYVHVAPPRDLVGENELGRMQNSLADNLLSDSKALKESSVVLLRDLYVHSSPWLTETIDLILDILNTAYNPNNARQIAMLLRRLPQHQKTSSQSLRNLIPLFCMGLLHIYHDQTRQVLCSILGDLATEISDEAIIINIALKWLQVPGVPSPRSRTDGSSESSTRLTTFQCSNLMNVEILSRKITEEYQNSKQGIEDIFENKHRLTSIVSPTSGRGLSLELFQSIPELAEKHSRLIVPVFLAAQISQRSDLRIPDSNESASSRTLSPGISEDDWNLRDRRSFLELFGRFKNPKVLYRSQEVYNALLEQLTNGSADIQRLALKALFTWKDATLLSHRETLLRLIDDESDKNEISLLLSADSEHDTLESASRADVLNLLLRILYGQMVGRSKSQGNQESKRKSILRLIFTLQPQEVIQFLNISFGRLAETQIVKLGIVQVQLLERDLIPVDQQYGLLRMLLSMMEVLQSQLVPFGGQLLQPVLYCTARACHQLNQVATGDEHGGSVSGSAMVRNVRKAGLQCLDMLFKHCGDILWSDYLDLIFTEIVEPRLHNFAIETAQGVSWMLRIFSTWSQSQSMVRFLLDHDNRLLEKIWESLTVASTKDEVKLFILNEVVTRIADLASEGAPQPNCAAEVLESTAPNLLTKLGVLLDGKTSKEVLHSAMSTLPMLVPFARSYSDAQVLLKSLILIHKDPRQKAPPKIKGRLLKAVESLLDLFHQEIDEDVRLQVYRDTSSMFNYFKDSSNRSILCNILQILARHHNLADAASICQDLNATSSSKLDEVDYDRQLRAFAKIDGLDIELNPGQWQPILYNLLYLSRTAEDFSIRSNAVNCLKNFIKKSCDSRISELEEMIRSIIIPAIRKGINEDSEAIRADYISLFGMVIQHLQAAPELEDLKSLLVQNDDEASFFTNILHIQQHRRLRALRRLSSEVENGRISASNIATFLLPLLEKFALDADDDLNSQNLKGQSIIAIGSLLQWMQWKQFKAAFRKFKKDLDSKSHSEKDIIKLLGVAADALTRANEENIRSSKSEGEPKSHLALSLPMQAAIFNELRVQFIPKLAHFVHLKDESQISLRIPAAVTAVKLLKILPQEEMAELISPVLLDISQILRSRTQESRDAARNTIADIVVLLGPSSIQFVLKELRTSLNRGYQLHVLSYTVHSILLVTVPHLPTGQLDYCMSDLAAVIMDDIFGVVGQEKENQDYVSSMREVKSNKSFDSMELLAKCASVRQLSKLIRPLQVLLTGNLKAKEVRHVDELLRRVAVGLSRNESANSRDLLTVSYELIQDFYHQKVSASERTATKDEINRQRYLVQAPTAIRSAGGSKSPLLYKLARFALDIVRLTLQKHNSLLTSQNVHGFLPILGDTLIDGQEDVKISALRLLSSIIKLPMPELEENAPLYVLEAVKVVKNSINANNESSQVALKLIAAILRERKTVSIRDSDLAYLLHRILPDLEEPDRQGVSFNFIKAIMSRRIILPELYELVDKIGIMMATNHASSSRDVARGVYVHFLLEYPQSNDRWAKQLKFLLKNLDYKHPEGRQSIMEAVDMLVAKTSGEITQEIITSFLFPVVLQMSNDENQKCREMAGALLGQFFKRTEPGQLKTLLEPVRSWTEQTENLTLRKIGMQAYGILFETSGACVEKEVPHLRSSIEKSLKLNDNAEDSDWELVFQALQLLLKIIATYPESVMAKKQTNLWLTLSALPPDSHPWIQSSVASLTSAWFQDLAKSNTNTGLARLPLIGKSGLDLTGETMLNLLRSMVRTIKHNDVNPKLSNQTVRNVIFIGRCLCVNDLTVQICARQTEDETNDEGDDDSHVESADDDELENQVIQHIPGIQYLLHQCASILRQEPAKLTTSTLLPKQSILELLLHLIPYISTATLNPCLQSTLLPLHHLTDPSFSAPKSADPSFSTTYEELIASAHEVMEAVRKKIGDGVYVGAMTAVARTVRERRESRRTKRRIERVAAPEKAARDKRRKGEKKKERKKELAGAFRRGRRGNG